METRADTLRAIGLSIGLHLVLLAALLVGLVFRREPVPLSVAGGAIEAVLLEDLSRPAAAPPVMPQAKPQPRPAPAPPQPKPEPRPEDAPLAPTPTPQAPLPKPDSVDQERVVREAALQAEAARREQEERRRQEQVLLDAKQQEEAERRKRLAQQQLEREKQLADIRKEREEAEKRRRLEEEKLKQLSDRREQAAAQTTPVPDAPLSDRLGNEGVDNALLGRYRLAIQQHVDRNWLRPDNLRPGLRCRVEVTQLRGGQVNGVDFSRCVADELTRRSIEAALMREPLPYEGYESVYQRKLVIPFCYPVEACQ